MRHQHLHAAGLLSFMLAGVLPAKVLAGQTLQTTGFSACDSNGNVTVTKLDISYNNDNQTVTFDVAGTSAMAMNVTAILNVTAYGISVYSISFDPCAPNTLVTQLCPVPVGTFAASGTQQIPSQYASMIPSIAFQVPDISADATLQLKSLDGGEEMACLTAQVGNGKTVSVPAVSYAMAGITGAALAATGASGISAIAVGGSAVSASAGAVSFATTFTWFQGIAMNGMMSVNYPDVYRSFSKNFAFSTGIVPWTLMQTSIDNFRAMTGGNLTDDNVQFLQNATLVFSKSITIQHKRAIVRAISKIQSRQITTSVNSSDPISSNNAVVKVQNAVSGISAYVEELSVPQANTFMTVLLITAIVIAIIAFSILLFKVILETWALFGSFPKSLAGFRKRYWGTMARTIVNLILVLYGVWVLYCIFQFTHGDSWAAQVLAAITLSLFTGVLIYFSVRIWQLAQKYKMTEGDAAGLYEDKETWIKYSLFYDNYKQDYWFVFIPAIIYMAAKGAVLAAADGHGLTQSVGQLIIECLMLGLLLWTRPYERKSGNVINIFIQTTRVLSVVCILVFVEELGISQTTQTITGVVLIGVQSAMTAALAILIAVNAIIICCKENPHRRRRKEAEQLQRDLDNLTPLDARNSLLIAPPSRSSQVSQTPSYLEPKLPSITQTVVATTDVRESTNQYVVAGNSQHLSPSQYRHMRSSSSRENLINGAASLGRQEKAGFNGTDDYRGYAY